ncbi:hypothetical protein Dda_6026 [Drechslerella dactyloides]|uniref:Deacetylase sirtuin-type domain-containing protein n=1 Tax=Drechslerella dactyloides TaxID=74499 RepID=A0AAD6IWA8_DREDA|nr:hypothetical protein Dda_6026 [Drechslerella dactyloides]
MTDDLEPPSKRRKITSSTDDSDAAPTSSPSPAPKPSQSSSFAVEIVVASKDAAAKGDGQQQQQPPSKQKQAAPKERTTERIDLSRVLSSPLPDKQLATWFDILNRKKKIIVIAGAGISVRAGIPDFRSSNGLFASVKSDYKLKASGKQLFDASVYKDDKSTSDFHDMVRNLHAMSNDAQPTVFHHLLASLAASNRLLRLYTQNVDCIETSLPPLATKTPLNNKGPWPKTVQLHGGLDTMTCSKCRAIKDFQPEIFVGPKPPDCKDCVDWEAARGASGKRSQGVGKLRPRIVLYNEHNPDEDAIGAVSTADLKARPDCLIVVGTSLKIPGVQRLVRELCASIRDFRGGKTVWINRDDPPATGQLKGLFDLIMKGDCENLARVSNVKHHDQFTPETDLKKITGTGMELGVSTPISMDSDDADSPLSSPASYSSSEEIWDSIKNNRPRDIPWPPPPKVVITARPLSPSASPHPKKITITKTGKSSAKAKITLSSPTKAARCKDGSLRKKPGPKPGWKKLLKAKEQSSTTTAAAPKSNNNKLTKAFKVGKTAPKVSTKPQKSTAPTKPAALPLARPKPEGRTIRVSMETLKRKAEAQNNSPAVSTPSPKLVLHGSDSSFTTVSSPLSSPTSSLSSPTSRDPKRGMRIQDLLS